MAATQMQPNVSVVTNPRPWVNFSSSLNTYGGALSGAATLLGPAALLTTNLALGRYVLGTSALPIQPHNQITFQFWLTAAAAKTANCRIWERRPELTLAEESCVLLATLALTAGAGTVTTGSTTLSVTSGFWVDAITTTADYTLNNSIKQWGEIAAGALNLTLDGAGGLGYVVEMTTANVDGTANGTAATAMGGRYFTL